MAALRHVFSKLLMGSVAIVFKKQYVLHPHFEGQNMEEKWELKLLPSNWERLDRGFFPHKTFFTYTETRVWMQALNPAFMLLPAKELSTGWGQARKDAHFSHCTSGAVGCLERGYLHCFHPHRRAGCE